MKKKNNNKTYGLAKERQLKKMFQQQGALHVERQRASFGCFDCSAYFPDYCLKISVKSVRTQYASFKAEIEKLKKVKVPKYCKKELWIWWSPHKNRKKKGWERVIIE